jgi:hypothetical protein
MQFAVTGALPASCTGPSLRSEFMIFSKLPKIDAGNQNSYDDKIVENSKKSQALRMTSRAVGAKKHAERGPKT